MGPRRMRGLDRGRDDLGLIVERPLKPNEPRLVPRVKTQIVRRHDGPEEVVAGPRRGQTIHKMRKPAPTRPALAAPLSPGRKPPSTSRREGEKNPDAERLGTRPVEQDARGQGRRRPRPAVAEAVCVDSRRSCSDATGSGSDEPKIDYRVVRRASPQ